MKLFVKGIQITIIMIQDTVHGYTLFFNSRLMDLLKFENYPHFYLKMAPPPPLTYYVR